MGLFLVPNMGEHKPHRNAVEATNDTADRTQDQEDPQSLTMQSCECPEENISASASQYGMGWERFVRPCSRPSAPARLFLR